MREKMIKLAQILNKQDVDSLDTKYDPDKNSVEINKGKYQIQIDYIKADSIIVFWLYEKSDEVVLGKGMVPVYENEKFTRAHSGYDEFVNIFLNVRNSHSQGKEAVLDDAIKAFSA